MRKFLEILFRHKLLLLTPPVLIGAAVAALTVLTAPLVYDSRAGIWVDKPTYLASTDSWNSWTSPAQNQAGRLTELVKTQSFLVDVAKRTSLAPLTTTPRGLDRLQTLVWQNFGVTPVGTHLVVLSFRAERPQLAFETLTAIVQTFNDSMANDQVNQAGIATSFYSDQLQQAQDDLNHASDDLRRYIQSNPRLSDLDVLSTSSSTDGIDGARVLDQLSLTDPTLSQLRSKVQTQQDRVTQIQKALQSAEFQASASVEGQQLGFQVIDAPSFPLTGGRDLKRRIIYPIGGLVGGLAISAIAFVLMAMSDRSVHSESDLVSGVRVIGEVPRFRLERASRELRRLSTRQAIGFIAGAALPAPKAAK